MAVHNLRPAFLGVVAALLAATVSAQTDLVTVATRINDDETSQAASSNTILNLLNSLSSSGTWADVNYADTSITEWSPATHTSRMRDLARAYRKSGHGYFGHPSVSNALHQTLYAWTSRDPKSSNWWYNEISTPLNMGRFMLLLGSEASTGEVAASMTSLNRSAIGGTGQNLLWETGNVLVKGLLLSSNSLVTTAAGVINALYVTTTSEGVQADGSFQQHGPQLYTGGYGAGFATDSAFWIDMLRGTAWAASTAQVDVVAAYLLDGCRWPVWEKQWDFGVTGRGISRGIQGATALAGACRRMTNVVPASALAFATFANALSGSGAFGNVIAGHRGYWRSDHAVHRRSNWYASVRMCSTRIQGSEAGNNEGLKDYHLGDGTTYFLRDGDEYRNIQPTWNWRMLPGITAPQSTAALPVLGWSGYMGGSSFVGGVNDGTNGAAVMTFSRNGLTLVKSWFLFGDAVVCAGADVRYTNTSDRIATTVNQPLWRTSCVRGVGTNRTTLATGAHVLTNGTWLLQDGFGYLPLDAGPGGVHRLTLQAQTGTWYAINTSGDTGAVTNQVMTLWVDHGVKPTNGTYAYAVIPNGTTNSMPAIAAAPPFVLLTNAAQVQAAWHTAARELQAIFHVAGEVTTPEGTRFEADVRCALMADIGTNTILLTVSRPDFSTAPLTVRVSRAVSGPGAVWNAATGETKLVLPVPTATDQRGRSVTYELEILAIGTTPGVNNDHGADAWMTTARLNGTLTTGGAAQVTACWDTSDRGTNRTAWTYAASAAVTQGLFGISATGLSPGSSYVYRCYASNVAGSAWSAARPFRTLALLKPDALTNLALWLDATDPSGVGGPLPTNNAAVTNWADKSGWARDALASANTAQWPRFRTAGLNGRPSIYFDGGDALDAGGDELHSNADGMTLLVVSMVTAQSDRAIVSRTAWSANQRQWVLHSTDFQVQERANTNNLGCRLDYTLTTNANLLAGVWQPGVRTELFRNGYALGTTAVAAVDLDVTPVHVVVGCANNGDSARYITGDLAEIVVYSRALASNELQHLTASIALEHGLSTASEPRNEDADADGLSDDWERTAAGNVIRLAGGDADGDGQFDWAEWRAGTDPLNAASVFVLANLTTSAEGLVLQWPSATGRTYHIESAPQPVGVYSALVTSIAATVPMNSSTVTASGAGAALRVRLAP